MASRKSLGLFKKHRVCIYCKDKGDESYFNIQSNICKPCGNAIGAEKRANMLNAMPKWLTKDHKEQILKAYKLAHKTTYETGIIHHVDHIEPLKGKDRTGLHVPWNLEVIPAIENIKKGNRT